MLPISNVAIPNVQFSLAIGNIETGNILKVVLIYIPVRSADGGLHG